MHARVGAPALPTDAPVVVLVHGLVISSLYMVPTAQRLAPFMRVLAPDLPGFGRSGKPAQTLDVRGLADALAEWLAACRLTRVVLVGNSLGCQVIVDLVSRRPDGVLGVVLAGATIDRSAPSMVLQIVRALRDVPRESVFLMPLWAIDFLRAGPRRAWRSLKYALAHRIELQLPAVTVPALVVRGARDPMVTQAWAEQVSKALPRARLHVIAGGPHAVNYTSAAEFAGLIRGFVDGLREEPA